MPLSQAADESHDEKDGDGGESVHKRIGEVDVPRRHRTRLEAHDGCVDQGD